MESIQALVNNLSSVSTLLLNNLTPFAYGKSYANGNFNLTDIIIDNISFGYSSCINLLDNTNDLYITLSTSAIFSILGFYIYSIVNNNSSISRNDNHNQITVKQKMPQIKYYKGLYLESIAEVNDHGKEIIQNIKEETEYWALLRVQMKNYINIAGTITDLHGNNIIGNTLDAFQTKDMYLVLRFKPLKNYNANILFGNIIVGFMNYLNRISDKKYHTSDFIVCAIGNSSLKETAEFTNGLKNINYEMENYINVKSFDGTNGGLQYVNYSLMLPIHNIYDLFMDVYNNCIFESKKYIIDDENYESWNGKSINELIF
jgi:hypothetical protein